MLLVGAAGLAVAHAAALRDVESFEAVATRTVGTVTDPGVEGPLVVEVDGRAYEIAVTSESYRQGEDVPVRVDPAMGRVALVAEPADTSWLLGWAAVCVVVAGCAWTTLWTRGRRRANLLRNGGPAVELLLLQGPFTLLSDTSPSNRRRGLVTGELVPVELAFAENPTEGPPPRRAAGHAPDSGHFGERLRPPEQLSDAEVQAWADQLNEEEDAEDDGPEEVEWRQVTVIGRLIDGFPLLVRDGPHLLLTTRPVRDPWMFRRLPDLILDKAGDGLPVEASRGRTSARWPAALSLPLALVLAVPAGLGLWWLFDDPAAPLTWRDALPLAGLSIALAAALHRLANTGLAVLDLHPSGLSLRGPLLTTVLPADRVDDVVAARHSIVLRLRTPDDLIDIDPAAIAGGPATPAEAADRVRHWLGQATTADVRWLRRPSPCLGPPALLLLTLATTAAYAL